MRWKNLWLVGGLVLFLAACQNDQDDGAIVETSSTSSIEIEESISESVTEEDKTIQFIDGVDKLVTRGDKYNYYALEGKADGFERVTVIIEGTAVDIRTTDNKWHFVYPYAAPNIETEITFTTDPTVEYGKTGIDVGTLDPESYVTLTFIPNDDPVVEEPAVISQEGQPQTFRNEDSSIVEIVTVTSIEVVEADSELNPVGEQLLKVEVQYLNDGTVGTHIAPNYFVARDGEGHFLPLRYAHFWLNEIAPGESFQETVYFDVTDEGPYTIDFFDGAWEDTDGLTGTEI